MKITRNKLLLFILTTAAVMLFGGCSSNVNENNIESFLCPFLDDGELELLLGENSVGWVNPYLRDEDLFSVEDVVFVSDNPDVVSIKFTEEKNGNFLYYQIDGVGIGDTYVYVQSYNGKVVSEKQHVTVIQKITEMETDVLGVDSDAVTKTVTEAEKAFTTYVLNTSTKKIHYSWCSSVEKIKAENYSTTTDYAGAISDGYVPCQKCNP